MSGQFQNSALILLAAVILIDSRVREVEVDTFVELITGFQNALRENDPMSREEISDWFDAHKSRIRDMLDSPKRDEKLRLLFDDLDSFVFKPHLLAAMESIAISDKELHSTEVDIIQMAADHWNLPMPHPV